MDTSFFPEGYKQPVTGGYFKFQDGENTFRVLSSAIVGYVYWNAAGKPVRSPKPFPGTPEDIRIGNDGKPDRVKHFWAFVVWNPDAEQVQIAEVTQQTVQSGIKALVDNKKWGNPTGYDITVTRSGSGLETEYQVMPSPHSPIPEEAVAALKEKPVNLKALYTGGDPFAPVEYDGSVDPELVPLEGEE